MIQSNRHVKWTDATYEKCNLAVVIAFFKDYMEQLCLTLSDHLFWILQWETGQNA